MLNVGRPRARSAEPKGAFNLVLEGKAHVGIAKTPVMPPGHHEKLGVCLNGWLGTDKDSHLWASALGVECRRSRDPNLRSLDPQPPSADRYVSKNSLRATRYTSLS